MKRLKYQKTNANIKKNKKINSNAISYNISIVFSLFAR